MDVYETTLIIIAFFGIMIFLVTAKILSMKPKSFNISIGKLKLESTFYSDDASKSE